MILYATPTKELLDDLKRKGWRIIAIHNDYIIAEVNDYGRS